MSNNSNFLKLKIKSLANNNIKNTGEKSNNYIISNKFKEESKDNKLNLSINTLKDSLTCLEDFKNSFYKNKNTIKMNETNYLKYNPNKNLKKIADYSSICTKRTISTENNLKEDKLYTNNKFKAINSLNKNKNENQIIKILLSKINIVQIKELKKIYEQLMEIFNDIKNISSNDESSQNNNDYINKLKILSSYYIRIFLSENIEYFTKLFYDSIEINAFILYQIYLFLNLIYLKEIKLSEYLLLSYRTIILYSSQNFDNILKIILDIKLLKEERIKNNILILNKIIVSILKTLTNIPSNSQIVYYINPIKYNNEINNDDLDLEKKINNRISGIKNILRLLKENKDLNEKLFQIEMKEINLNKEVIAKNSEIEEKIKYQNGKTNEKILPNLDINKYKYSVVLELDETLVHYCEEDNNFFVKVRNGCEDFLDFIHNFCEIIIFSTSGIEYSNIVIDNLNKNSCLIDNRIYKENHKDIDLSKINRDLNKTFFICHEENFFNVPKENIIKLTEFDGDENDKEFLKLLEEFEIIENKTINDIRDIIPKIQSKVENGVNE